MKSAYNYAEALGKSDGFKGIRIMRTNMTDSGSSTTANNLSLAAEIFKSNGVYSDNKLSASLKETLQTSSIKKD